MDTQVKQVERKQGGQSTRPAVGDVPKLDSQGSYPPETPPSSLKPVATPPPTVLVYLFTFFLFTYFRCRHMLRRHEPFMSQMRLAVCPVTCTIKSASNIQEQCRSLLSIISNKNFGTIYRTSPSCQVLLQSRPANPESTKPKIRPSHIGILYP